MNWNSPIPPEEHQKHYDALTKIITERYPRIKGAHCASIAYGVIDYICSLSEAAALAEKSLATETKALVPEHWKLVPIDPTEAMIHAAEDVAIPRPFGKVYRAMLAAAPSIPQDGQKSEAQ